MAGFREYNRDKHFSPARAHSPSLYNNEDFVDSYPPRQRSQNSFYSDPLHPQYDGQEFGPARARPGGFNTSFSSPHEVLSHDTSPDDPFLRGYADKSVGLLMVVADNLLSHPFLVLRRQCQVHVESKRYHLSPFTLISPVFHVCQRQGLSVIWKGLGSTILVRGLTMAVEDVTSKVTPWPKEITRHSSFKSVCQHILLKSLSLAVITPFYSASLVETAQSDVASEKTGMFDIFREGIWRLLSWPSTGRLVPLHSLIVPTVAHGLLSYLIFTGIRSVSLSTIKRVRESKERQQGALSKDTNVSFYSEMSASIVGHVVADALLFPLETILHRLHLQGTRTIIDNLDCGIEVTPVITSYAGVLDCIRTTLDEEGFAGLYKGFGAVILQYGLQMLLMRAVKIVMERTPFGQSSSPSPAAILAEKNRQKSSGAGVTLSQSHSEPGNINKNFDSPLARVPSHQFQIQRDSTMESQTTEVERDATQFEPRYRSARLSNYNPDLSF